MFGTIFLNPNGIQILGTPFRSIEDTYQYVSELLPFGLDRLLSFSITKMSPSFYTVFNVIFLFASLSVITALWKRRVRVSHLLMFIGGALLLSKGIRFTYEFVLLSLPLLRSNPLITDDGHQRRIPLQTYLISTVVLIVIPIMFFQSVFSNRPEYPFSKRGLPHGVAIFLKNIDAGGSIMNHHNTGSYLQWMLYPRYRIFMDMQLQLFTDEDFYTLTNALHNREVFRRFISKYDPSFISVPIIQKDFKGLIKNFPDYRLIFFDDSTVLYINSNHFPDIAEKYGLEKEKIDPFTLVGRNLDTLTDQERRSLMPEVKRLLRVYPDGGITN
jgi:hypothetical protein